MFHNFDCDPDDEHKFVLTEVYRKSEDFLFHANNPLVQEYLEKHADLATHFSIKINGNVSNEVTKNQLLRNTFEGFCNNIGMLSQVRAVCVTYAGSQYY